MTSALSSQSLNLKCTFDVTIPDTEAPSVTCPSSVTQSDNRIASFSSASATDNSGVNPTITYSAASGS